MFTLKSSHSKKSMRRSGKINKAYCMPIRPFVDQSNFAEPHILAKDI